MKVQMWRVGLSAVLALGVVVGLAFAVSNASASNGAEQSKVTSADNWGNCWYWVRRGDTLFRIGLRYGVSPYYLAHLNGLWNPNYIYAGMKLLVPCGGGKPPPPPKPQPCVPGVVYVVKPGDNLFRIALNHGSTVNAIRDANQLWGKVLRPGQKLDIPCPKNGAAPPPEATVMPIPPTSAPGDQQPPPPTTAPTDAAAPTQPLPPEPSASVVLGASSIDPNLVTIQAGQSVVWINNSENIYTLVSGLPGQPNDQFTSGELPPGATFIHTFDAAGSYSYHVSENPTLIGQVAVNP
jgi:LysM repeat protein